MSTNSTNSDQAGQRIDALDFELPGQSSSSQESFESTFIETSASRRPWWHSQFNLMIAVFALLLAAALLFIVFTPSPDAQRLSLIHI